MEKNTPKINEGYILLSRQLLESKLWSSSDATLRIAIYLLLSANHQDKYFKRVLIKRGQTCKSLSKISDDCGVSIKAVRYALDILEEDKFLERDYPFGAKQGQRITICNYATYQDPNNYKGILGAHAGNIAGASNNNDKKEKNIDNYRDIVIRYRDAFKSKYPNFASEVDRNYNEQAWCDIVDELIRLDGHSRKDVIDVLNFALNDEFWYKQVRSIAGLRKNGSNGCKKFDNIKAKMSETKSEKTVATMKEY